LDDLRVSDRDGIIILKRPRHFDEYRPPVIIGDDTGFSDPAFIANVGKIAQGVLDRSAWEKGKPGSVTAKINEMFKARSGYDLDDTSARNMQALFVLADAINRAGSTKPDAIRQALQQTDLKSEQLMMGYRGVKFDSTQKAADLPNSRRFATIAKDGPMPSGSQKGEHRGGRKRGTPNL
jgi:branched-chain amino acid transport system substrate-binding protein